MTIAIPARAWGKTEQLGEGLHPQHPPLALLAGLPRPVLLHVAQPGAEADVIRFLAAPVAGSKVVIGGPATGADCGATFLPPFTNDLLAAAYCAADIAVVLGSTGDDASAIVDALSCGVPVAALPGEAAHATLGQDGRGADGNLPMTVGAVDADLALAIEKARHCDRLGAAVLGCRLAGRAALQPAPTTLAA